MGLGACSTSAASPEPLSSESDDLGATDASTTTTKKKDASSASSDLDASVDSGFSLDEDKVACTATCDATKVCVAALCCPPPTATGTFKVPTHTNYVFWKFAKRVAKLEFKVDMKNDPGSKVGLYFSPYNAEIDGIQFYFGIQTDLLNNNAGGKHEGHGIIFSQFGTLDKASINVAPGGFSEVGTHEGNFIGVRLPFAWTKGSYTIRFERGAGDDTGDWFEAHVVDASKKDTFAGALKFARKGKGVPATFEEQGTAFTEVYSGATDYANVPKWHIDTMAYGDGQKATTATSSYPNYPAYPGIPSFPNTDVTYSAASDRVELRFGGDTAKCHPEGKLF